MLTIDDANTIIEKYGDTGFWYPIDFSKFDISSISLNETMSFIYDSFPVTFELDEDYLRVNCYIDENIYATNIAYMERHDGTINVNVNHYEDRILILTTKSTVVTNPFILYIYVTSNPVSIEQSQLTSLNNILFIPLSALQIPVVNGEFDDKFYIKQLGGSFVSYMIDGEDVSYSEDEKGRYITLPSANNCTIGVRSNISSIDVYNVTFQEFKSLPMLNIPTLYRGTPQKITLINSDTEEEITEFQAYYNGRLLKENIIELPYDVEDYINIVIELKDPEYIKSTIKLKVATELKLCISRNQVMKAIDDGIKTIQAYNSNTSGIFTVSDVDLKDITFINSRLGFQRCTVDNVRIIETEDFENGLIRISNNTIMNNCNLENLTGLQVNTRNNRLNNCTLKNIDLIQSYGVIGTTRELLITGSITNSNIDNLVVISDGEVTVTNNNFTGKSYIDYFPNFLYLTGVYNVTGNTFNLTGEWEELAYNMCLIKATSNFNPSNFIKQNNLQLNITYDDEPTNTFYYNIVDDDKIRAVRL